MHPHQDRAAQEVAVRADPVDPEAVKAEHPIRLINGLENNALLLVKLPISLKCRREVAT